MNRFLMKISFLIVILLLCSGCENPFTGYGPQPIYLTEPDDEVKLNIFGIVRPGEQQGFSMSFVHVEAAFSVTDLPDSLEVDSVNVQITSEDDTSRVFDLVYGNPDDVFSRKDYRNQSLRPEACQTYSVRCEKEGYPVLTGRTTVPNIPFIVEIQIEPDNTQLYLTVARDSLAGLIEVVFQSGEQQFSTRAIRPDSGDIHVNLHIDSMGKLTGVLMIFAYDMNLSEYMTYNISVKPNSYLDMYSTVEGGHGCFGSLNFLNQTVNLYPLSK